MTQIVTEMTLPHLPVEDPAFAAQTKEFSTRLLAILRDAKDPRVTGDGGTFDRSPFSDPEVVPSAAAKKGGKKAAK